MKLWEIGEQARFVLPWGYLQFSAICLVEELGALGN